MEYIAGPIGVCCRADRFSAKTCVSPPHLVADEGGFGIAMSQTVAVTDTGSEVLTHLDRKLLQIQQ